MNLLELQVLAVVSRMPGGAAQLLVAAPQSSVGRPLGGQQSSGDRTASSVAEPPADTPSSTNSN